MQSQGYKRVRLQAEPHQDPRAHLSRWFPLLHGNRPQTGIPITYRNIRQHRVLIRVGLGSRRSTNRATPQVA